MVMLPLNPNSELYVSLNLDGLMRLVLEKSPLTCTRWQIALT